MYKCIIKYHPVAPPKPDTANLVHIGGFLSLVVAMTVERCIRAWYENIEKFPNFRFGSFYENADISINDMKPVSSMIYVLYCVELTLSGMLSSRFSVSFTFYMYSIYQNFLEFSSG